MKFSLKFGVLLMILWLSCCASNNSVQNSDSIKEEPLKISGLASVTKVEVPGNENTYTFNVTVLSPDTGCDQYADWWEVLDLEGNLIYRRILAHSHVGEQPFTRSGGTIAILENTEVYIRAHMNTSGYGNQALKGTVLNGFTIINLDVEFSKELENNAPLPSDCAF